MENLVDIEIINTKKKKGTNLSLGSTNEILSQIRKELGSLKEKAPSILKNAINKAVTQTKKTLLGKVKKDYKIAAKGEDTSKKANTYCFK